MSAFRILLAATALAVCAPASAELDINRAEVAHLPNGLTLLLLEDRSFSGLSLREVTREAGIVPAAFYRHFDSKDALGLVLIDESFRSLREMLHSARAGKLDFLDLLLRVRNLVRDNPQVRRGFQRRFKRIFVDEFQDTDPLQAEILLLLAADDPDETDWRKARPAAGRAWAAVRSAGAGGGLGGGGWPPADGTGWRVRGKSGEAD